MLNPKYSEKIKNKLFKDMHDYYSTKNDYDIVLIEKGFIHLWLEDHGLLPKYNTQINQWLIDLKNEYIQKQKDQSSSEAIK